jgi:hypothetical protein
MLNKELYKIQNFSVTSYVRTMQAYITNASAGVQQDKIN